MQYYTEHEYLRRHYLYAVLQVVFLHRMGSAGHFNDRAVRKVIGEEGGVNCGGHKYYTEVRVVEYLQNEVCLYRTSTGTPEVLSPTMSLMTTSKKSVLMSLSWISSMMTCETPLRPDSSLLSNTPTVQNRIAP